MNEIRFDFGKNWRRYSSGIDESTIYAACQSLSALLSLAGEYRNGTFLDIGCGSGIHAIAAARIGFRKITATDFDPESVSTTLHNVARFEQPDKFDVFVDDILNSKLTKRFDVVYSWGVLHHTGEMWIAIRKAAEFVCPGGVFCISIYKKTTFCSMWKNIKRIYAASGPTLRTMILGFYLALSLPAKFVRRLVGGRVVGFFRQPRGMSWLHDSIDWVGGYPYESASPTEVVQFVESLGFRCTGMSNVRPVPIRGLLGSGCAEFVFKKM